MDAIFADRYISSDLTFWGSVSNFSYNIYLVSAIYFLPMTEIELAGCLALVFIQTGTVLISTPSFIAIANVLNRPGRYLLALPHCFEGSSMARHKIALMSLAESVHTHHPFYFKLGILGSISSKTFKFIFFYSGTLIRNIESISCIQSMGFTRYATITCKAARNVKIPRFSVHALIATRYYIIPIFSNSLF